MLALPAGLVKELGQCPTGSEPHAVARNRKKTIPKLIYNNLRSSIKLGSTPNPKIT